MATEPSTGPSPPARHTDTDDEAHGETEPDVGIAGRPSPRLRRAVLGGLALALGLAASLLGDAWFPELSGNNDEPVYLFQARQALDGEFTFPDDEVHADLMRVWLSGPSDGKVVFPFNPPYPTFLAATGGGHGWRWLPRLLTGAMIVPALWLAYHRLGAARARWMALLLAMASPLLVLQSALFLPYVFTLTLELLAFAAVLTAVRRDAVGWSVAAGLLWSVAFWTRPFDALLAAGAVGLALFIGRDTRGDAGRVVRHGLFTAAAAVPVLVATAGFNWHATGSPLRFPISVAGGENTFGFGTRSVAADTAAVEYSAGDAVSSTASNLYGVVQWLPGGWVIVGLAAVGLLRARSATAVFCVTMAGAFTLGYVFWFANELTVAGAISGIGPHYHLPVLFGLCGLAGLGLAHLLARYRPSGVLAVGALVVIAVAHQAYYWPDRADDKDFVTSFNEEWADAATAIEPGPDGTMVILGDEKPNYLLDEAPTVGNDGYDIDAEVIYVNDTDPAGLRSLAGDRSVWLLWDQHGLVPDVGGAEQTLVAGDCVAVTTTLSSVSRDELIQYAGEGADRPSIGARSDTVTWSLSSEGVSFASETLRWPEHWGVMKLGVAIDPQPSAPGVPGPDAELREMWVRYSLDDGTITVMAPGQLWSSGSDVLEASVSTC